jgi:hypothetical protein
MTSKNKTQLVVVVNGVETVVEANLNAPLRTVAQHALNASGNQGRPLADWELKDERGQLLDLDRPISTFTFAANAVLYLTLSVGVNGIRQRYDCYAGFVAAQSNNL